MPVFTFAEITGWLGHYLWPLFRITALLMIMPMLSSQVVIPRIRLLLAMAITLVVAPLLPDAPAVNPLSGTALLLLMQQLAIGFMMGLVLHIYFAIFTTAGQIISMQMGLGMAVMYDPLNGTQIPVISQVFQLLSFLMFLAVDGHLVVISILIESFSTLPIAPFTMSHIQLSALPPMVGWLFASALLVVLPGVLSLLVVSFTFGVMNRSAPQFNIFSVGFPLTMLAGMAILLLISSSLSGVFIQITQEALESLRRMVL